MCHGSESYNSHISYITFASYYPLLGHYQQQLQQVDFQLYLMLISDSDLDAKSDRISRIKKRYDEIFRPVMAKICTLLTAFDKKVLSVLYHLKVTVLLYICFYFLCL